MLRRRVSQPGPEAPRVITAMEFRGAVTMPDYSGWWVYCLGRLGADPASAGYVFYAGQSDHLISRLRDHQYNYPELYDPRAVALMRVRDEYQACLWELEMIDYYQPEYNTMGRADELRRRLALYQARQRRAGRSSVDSGQVTG